VRRIAVALLTVPIAVLLAAGPVVADTSPNGTNFNSFATTCSTTGGKQVCTDTNLFVSSNEDGSAAAPCLDLFTYSISANGRFTGISDEFGCGDDSSVVTIGSDLSVTIDATPITIESCRQHSCTGSRTVTLSASDTPTGPITTTTTKSTTKAGDCTTKMTTTDVSAELAGTITIDGAVIDETGFVDVFTSTSITHCK
jgi:hypothetical protein